MAARGDPEQALPRAAEGDPAPAAPAGQHQAFFPQRVDESGAGAVSKDPHGRLLPRRSVRLPDQSDDGHTGGVLPGVQLDERGEVRVDYLAVAQLVSFHPGAPEIPGQHGAMDPPGQRGQVRHGSHRRHRGHVFEVRGVTQPRHGRRDRGQHERVASLVQHDVLCRYPLRRRLGLFPGLVRVSVGEERERVVQAGVLQASHDVQARGVVLLCRRVQQCAAKQVDLRQSVRGAGQYHGRGRGLGDDLVRRRGHPPMFLELLPRGERARDELRYVPSDAGRPFALRRRRPDGRGGGRGGGANEETRAGETEGSRGFPRRREDRGAVAFARWIRRRR